MNIPNRLKPLIYKYLLGKESKDEFECLKNSFEEIDTEQSHSVEDSFQRIKIRLDNNILETKKVRRIYYKHYWAVASILLILGFAGTILFQHLKNSKTELTAAEISQIIPVNEDITISFDNGKTVSIQNDSLNQLANLGLIKDKKGSLDFSNADDIQFTTIHVPKAKNYHFTLSDGTKVWLNANSKLSFPSKFISTTRQIILEGEGYFEVAHNIQKPFIVETKNQKIEVLGTHFNINDYEEKYAPVTTLVEGSIRLSTSSDQLILKPSEQCIISNPNQLKSTIVNVEDFIGWKDGYFMFKNATAEDVINQLNRWYDFNLDVDKNKASSERFTGKIANTTHIADILKIMKAMGIELKLYK